MSCLNAYNIQRYTVNEALNQKLKNYYELRMRARYKRKVALTFPLLHKNSWGRKTPLLLFTSLIGIHLIMSAAAPYFKGQV